MKKVIVISTSLRAGSNSDMLADKFIEGALAAGNEVEKITLSGKNIGFCKGCLADDRQGAQHRLGKGQCQRHYAKGARSRSGGLGNAHLLL